MVGKERAWSSGFPGYPPPPSPYRLSDDQKVESHSTTFTPLLERPDHESLRDSRATGLQDYKNAVDYSRYDDMSSHGDLERYIYSNEMSTNFDDHKGDKVAIDGPIGPDETVEEYRESTARRRWVALCTLLTWMIPGFLLDKVGGMKRADVRQAWREKVAVSLPYVVYRPALTSSY